MRTRPTGSLVADRRGTAAQFALMNLQERGTLFVGPGEEVYEGMIVGENARATTSTSTPAGRSSSPTSAPRPPRSLVRLVPHRKLSLDQALEFLREDECVEVDARSACACARSHLDQNDASAPPARAATTDRRTGARPFGR